MVNKDTDNKTGAMGEAATRGTNSFAAILHSIYPMPVPALAYDSSEYQDLKNKLGCANEKHYVTQEQFVLFAVFVQKCFEAQSTHMDAAMSHICKHFTKLIPNRDAQLLAMDNEFPFKDDQLVSPKVIEQYTNYSDTAVRTKLQEAVISGQIERIVTPMIDKKTGKQKVNKDGTPSTSRPRYRWADVKMLFSARRVQVLSARERNRIERAQALQKQYAS